MPVQTYNPADRDPLQFRSRYDLLKDAHLLDRDTYHDGPGCAPLDPQPTIVAPPAPTAIPEPAPALCLAGPDQEALDALVDGQLPVTDGEPHGGWFSIDRFYFENPKILSIPVEQRYAVLCLLSATNYEDTQAKVQDVLITIKRGQQLFARRSFALRFDITEWSARKAVEALVMFDTVSEVRVFPARKGAHNPTLITFKNYDHYQSRRPRPTPTIPPQALPQPAHKPPYQTREQGNKLTSKGRNSYFSNQKPTVCRSDAMCLNCTDGCTENCDCICHKR